MTVLKVSKMSNPHAVAGAIAGLIRDEGLAVVQAIGAAATNQAIKAIAIARSFMRPEGVDLICAPGFTQVEFNGTVRTALRFEIATRPAAGGLDGASSDGHLRAETSDGANLEETRTSD